MYYSQMPHTHQRRKEDTLNLRVDPALKAEFMDAAETENKPAAEVLRNLMRAYVQRARAQKVCRRGPQAVATAWPTRPMKRK